MSKPKLRFSEFDGDYKPKFLSDITELIKDGTHGTHKDVTDGIPLLSAKDIFNNRINIPLNSRKISEEDYNKIYSNYKLKENDILMTIVGTIGRTAIYKNENVAFQRSVATIRVKENDSNYIRNYLESSKVSNQLSNMTNSSAQGGIYLNSLSKIKLNLPLQNEQTKVSNFLSLLDKKIELQSKKIEDLKLFKLCIRKTIFSLNADTNIKLKDIVNCESSNITLSDIENDNGMYPVYGATGFIKNIKNHKFDSEYIAIVKDGAGVGRTMMCPKNSSILATMNALIVKNNYPLNYICEMINTISFDKYIVGSGIPHIYFKDYGNEEFMMHNINDAIKFNNFFKCIDKKIELLNIKLDKLNTLKKGLMQNMFV